MIRGLLIFLLSLSCLIFTACVEGEEEVWIHPDASGRFLAHYEIPSIALKKMIPPEDLLRTLRKVDENEDGLEITALSFENQRGRAVFHIEATFQDVRKLLEISERSEKTFAEETDVDPAQMEGAGGDIAFKIDGLTPTFARVISLKGMIPPEAAGFLGKSNFKYTMHLPAKVKESNAHSIRNNGRTVSWTFLLKEHLEQPMEMSFTTELPVPWWAWLVLALIVIFVIALVWMLWRRFRA